MSVYHSFGDYNAASERVTQLRQIIYSVCKEIGRRWNYFRYETQSANSRVLEHG